MKEIVIIQQNLGAGGAEKVLINILNNIDYEKYKVTLFLIYKSGVYLDSINKNVNLIYMYDPNKFKSRILQSIYYRTLMIIYNNFPKLIYKNFIGKNFDIEIAFLEGESTKFLSNSINKDSKKIAWIHTDMNNHTKEELNIEKEYYKKVDKIICVSNDSKRSFDEIYCEFSEKSLVIYNLIDINDIVYKSNYKIENNYCKPILLAIGRLINLKRFDLLIKAHKLLIDEGVENILLILGEGNRRKELQDLIDYLNLNDSVKLLGFKRNPYPYIKECDIFVISSDYEGFSLVTAEAMVLGKSIVSTNCTGPLEIITKCNNGKIVEKGNINQLAEAIKEILTDKNIKRNFEQKSIEGSKIFNSEQVMRKIYDVIDNL